MRIGMVCPYSFDVHGGVQAHVLQLAEVMRERGHHVSVLAPSSPHVELPDYVVSGGKAVPIPYNGSVARLRFGPSTHRLVKRWIAAGDFDVLHLHEPNAPSLSLLALMVAEGPIVATFHTSTTKSLALGVFQGLLRPWNEKIVGRIAVSDLARRWQIEALGSDAVEIPNGVDVDAFAAAEPLPGYPRPGKTVLFLGRFDEPRKGMEVLLAALPAVAERFSDVQILVVGRGDEDDLREEAGDLSSHLRFLGEIDDAEKAAALRSADVYCAPNTGGESFGIVLCEAMAAGTPVVASDLDAFRRVLADGEAGRLVRVEDPDALAEALIGVLADDRQRAGYVAAASEAVRRYDWQVVADEVKRGMAEMLKGGVIMDVVTAEQAKIAEDAPVPSPVMALERVPADIRAQGGVSRMSDPDMIDGIIEAVSIPVMAKARIGHFVEAQICRASGSTTSTSPRCSPRPTTPTTSTSGPSRCRSSAVRPTSARRCAGSPRVRR
jgi:phosphatidylinositol alpha-mannosyltransferase